jgi:hypothetical protein
MPLKIRTGENIFIYPGSRGLFLLFSFAKGRGKINLWNQGNIHFTG